MKKIIITLEYRSNDQYDNKMYKGLLELNKCIDDIDDLFIKHIQITDIDKEENA